MAKEWFYQMMGAEIGPLSSADLKRKAQLGQIQFDTLVRSAPDGKWMPAERVKGLIDPPPVEPSVHSPLPVRSIPQITISPPDTAIGIPVAGSSSPTSGSELVYHFLGDTAVDVTVPVEAASGEFDFFKMVGFELALGTPLHQALVDRCRSQHLTMTEVTRRALAEYLGCKNLLEQPAVQSASVGVG